MVVNRCHLENAPAFSVFLLCILEICYLDHHRKCFQNVHQCNQQQYQMLMRCKAYCCHCCAQVHGTGVTHKALCRVQIPHQKAQTAAGQCHGKQGIGFHLQLAANQGKDQHCHQCYCAAQTIYAVSQIDSIGQVQNHQNHQRIVEERDVKLDKRQINHCASVSKPVHCSQPQNSSHNLQYNLLHGF